MAQSKFVYVGIKGSVLALNSATGQQLWARKLKGDDFVHVALDGDNIYAATHGEVFCLDLRSGVVRWHNPLTGYGWGLVSLAIPDAELHQMPLRAAKRRRDEQAAAATSASAAT